MAVIALTLGLMVPAISGLGKANELSAGARMVSNALSSARTEAITQRAVTRLMIVTDWPGDERANYRKLSIWRHDATAATAWKQVGLWEQLPSSVTFEPTAPSYSSGSDPAGYFLGGTQNIFASSVAGKMVTMKFVEFLPSGAARIPQTPSSEVWAILASGELNNQTIAYSTKSSSGSPANWAKIGAGTLTGRIRVSQP